MVMLEIIVGAAAAIILFLFGIENLSNEMQRIAGDRLRGVLARVMANRWMGAAISAITTSLIQSSSATTVIAVGLVNAGLITFSQSLGIIAGANIGTTITAQLVALDLLGIAPFLMVFGFLFSIFGLKYRFLGKSIFYFGLVFFSLMLLSNAIAPFKGDPEVENFIARFNDPLSSILIGIAITAVFQSSSVTTGIVVLFGLQGLIGLSQAVPIIMGANIGTTITAILAAYRLDAFARRTAAAHFIFNVLGVLVFLPFMEPFTAFVRDIGGDTGTMIANAHLIFNMTTAIIFLLFADRIAAAVSSVIKTEAKEVVFRLRYLDKEIPENTSGAIALVLKELEHELEYVKELFSLSLDMAKSGRASELHRTAKLEALSDFLDEKVSETLGTLSRRKLSGREAREIAALARISNEIEQLADLGKDISRVAQRMDEHGLRLLPVSYAELSAVDSLFFQNFEILKNNFMYFKGEDLKKADKNSKQITKRIEKSYLMHIARMWEEKPAHYAGTYFTDLMASIEAANAKVVSIMEHRKALGKNIA